MSEPLAIYREVRVDGRRRFDLYADRIIVAGKAANMDFETTIALSDLKPKSDTLWIRHGWFRVAILMFWGSFSTLVATVAAHEAAPEREGLSMAFGQHQLRAVFLGINHLRIHLSKGEVFPF